MPAPGKHLAQGVEGIKCRGFECEECAEFTKRQEEGRT